MIFERAIKYIRRINLNNFTKLDELVEHLHKKFWDTRREIIKIYWTFLTCTLSNINNSQSSINNSIGSFAILKETLSKLEGIISFYLTIYPDADMYLNDEVFAEYILSASENGDKKFTILNTGMLVSKTNTPELYKLLNKNISRVKQVHQKLDIGINSQEVYSSVWN